MWYFVLKTHETQIRFLGMDLQTDVAYPIIELHANGGSRQCPDMKGLGPHEGCLGHSISPVVWGEVRDCTEGGESLSTAQCSYANTVSRLRLSRNKLGRGIAYAYPFFYVGLMIPSSTPSTPGNFIAHCFPRDGTVRNRRKDHIAFLK